MTYTQPPQDIVIEWQRRVAHLEQAGANPGNRQALLDAANELLLYEIALVQMGYDLPESDPQTAKLCRVARDAVRGKCRPGALQAVACNHHRTYLTRGL
jgi:hypothetical protein